MKRILLFSFFNSNNIGDRAISTIFRETFETEYEVVCCSNEGSFNICDKYTPEEILFGERIKRKILCVLKKRYKSPMYKRFLDEYKNKLDKCSCVVFGGGNLMMDYSKKTNSSYKIQDYVEIAKAYGCKCYAFSIGIGPFASNIQAKRAAETLNMFDYITFRDKKSYDLFVNNGGIKGIAGISIDPVFSLSSIDSSNCDRNVIALNVINPTWFGVDNAKNILNQYCRFVLDLSERFPNNTISLFCTELTDRKAQEYIYDYVSDRNNVTVVDIYDIKQLNKLYSCSKIVLGARMHSLIIAYGHRVPVIGLSWTDKVCEFFSIIDKPERCFNIFEMCENKDRIFDLIEVNEEWDFEPLINKSICSLSRALEVIE